MPVVSALGRPVRAPAGFTRQAVERIRQMLSLAQTRPDKAASSARNDSETASRGAPDAAAEEASMQALLEVLLQAGEALARGHTVQVMAIDEEITTQQAAEVLGVSRPYLIRLLERGEIPYQKVGSHRRVRLAEVLAYKQRRDAERRRALQELTRMSQQLGLYDED